MFNIKFNDSKILSYIILREGQCCNKLNLEEIRDTLGYNRSNIEILLFDSLAEMSGYLNYTLPRWVIGTNFNRKILLLNYDLWKNRLEDTPFQIVIHEYVHIVINEKTQYKCPRWLNEGLALYFAKQTKGIDLPKIFSEKDSIYSLNYGDQGFYEACACFTEYLIMNYGIKSITQKLEKKTCFYQDSLLGTENINSLFQLFLKKSYKRKLKGDPLR